jgi:hypothetical protein
MLEIQYLSNLLQTKRDKLKRELNKISASHQMNYRKQDIINELNTISMCQMYIKDNKYL